MEKQMPQRWLRNVPYSRVVYGNLNPEKQDSRNSDNMEETAMSTLTSDSKVVMGLKNAVGNAIETTKSIKCSILEEMRSLNKQSEDRMGRIEDSTKAYDEVMHELHNNNKKKAQEMAKYEAQLSQIGETTKSIAMKMDRTDGKFDKLSAAMKTFISVMADVVGPKNANTSTPEERQRNLKELSSLLDDDDSDELLTQEQMETEECSNTTTLPGTKDALSGEGAG